MLLCIICYYSSPNNKYKNEIHFGLEDSNEDSEPHDQIEMAQKHYIRQHSNASMDYHLMEEVDDNALKH